MKDTNIKDRFLQLTSRTYPHGTEKELFHLLPSELQEDEFGNLFIQIGESDVMFTSHLDTATSALGPVLHTHDNNIIRTDGNSILGADDKAGVTIMIHMIENNIPGLYYFFLGEEVGCVGSKKLRDKHTTQKIEGINKVISFDRRGTTSVITFQASSRCCSDKFGEALSAELNKHDSTFTYKNDPTGIYTDSAQFVKIYPECTNISVGYQNEHTHDEWQDIEHLDKLAQACLKVDWNSLPVERDPSKVEYSYGGYGWDWDNDWSYGGGYGGYGGYGSSTRHYTTPVVTTEKEWFHDKKYNYVSSFEVNKATKKIISVDLCEHRVIFEKQIISDLLISLEIDFESIEWDGLKLMVQYTHVQGTGHITNCDRNDLLEYLPELDYHDEIGGINEEEFLDKDIYD
jgi:hypothetical protein